MGVAGAGKTTVGRLVASELGLAFHDADDFHSERSRAKMAAGVALSERDRGPWLRKLAKQIPVWEAGGGAVLACSALKAQHRTMLEEALPGRVFFVFLDADPELIRPRLAARAGHYMPASLLESQLAALEPPAPGDALTVSVDGTPRQIAQSIVTEIRQRVRVDAP